ncbi:MAG: cell division protein ZapA [Paludibacteraceae bacterium]|nr:cell division protein ZapA [Paludibacteraceae bacterium]
MADKKPINLELVGKRYSMKCSDEEEPLYREAAALIKDEYQSLVNRYGNNAGVKEEDLKAYTLLQLALKLKSIDMDKASMSKRLESLDLDLSNFMNQHK